MMGVIQKKTKRVLQKKVDDGNFFAKIRITRPKVAQQT